mgnify:CR=1 FL=1
MQLYNHTLTKGESVMTTTNKIQKQLELRGRILNRDFIFRKRVNKRRWEFGKELKEFKSYQFGKFSIYLSKKPIVFWNMQGIVSTTKRDYSVQPVVR